jgi:hypothetical protein
METKNPSRKTGDWQGHDNVPGLLHAQEINAKVLLVKALAADLDYIKPNFAMTVRSIIAHAKDLERHERRLRGQVQAGR